MQVLADQPGIRDDEPVILDERLDGSGGVHLKVFRSPLPYLFQPQVEWQALFGQDQSHLAGERRQGQMVQDSHRARYRTAHRVAQSPPTRLMSFSPATQPMRRRPPRAWPLTWADAAWAWVQPRSLAG